MSALAAALRGRVEGWIAARHPIARGSVELDRRRVYILPTGFGYAFAGMLAVMFLWAINYNNSMGFALTFLLGAVAVNAMWRCHGNLLGLRMRGAAADPVYAGQTARFGFVAENPGPSTRVAICIERRGCGGDCGDVPASGTGAFGLDLPAGRRGRLRAGRVAVCTRYPLELFRAWSWVELDLTCVVYPAPKGGRALPAPRTVAGAGAGSAGEAKEDFAGLRAYRPGDSPRHVAWKAAARSDDLLVKVFAGQGRSELWLDWSALDPLPVEARLSQLCQWVLMAEAEGLSYALALPDRVLGPGQGERHRRACLEALALFGLPSADG